MNVRRFMGSAPSGRDWSLLPIATTGNDRRARHHAPPPIGPSRSSTRAGGRRAPGEWLPPNDAASLTNDHQLIRVDRLDRFGRAARPGDLQPVGAGPVAESDDDPKIVLGTEASAATH